MTLRLLRSENPYPAWSSSGSGSPTAWRRPPPMPASPSTVNRVGSMLTTFFTDAAGDGLDHARQAVPTRTLRAFFHAMLARGVYLAPSQFEAGFVSAAHTEEDIAFWGGRPVEAMGRHLRPAGMRPSAWGGTPVPPPCPGRV